MKTRTLKQLLLYNYRYLFAYLVIFGFIAYFLGWQLGHIGPGLSSAEITTAARHTSFSNIAKLPVYPLQAVLQLGSIKTFGITAASLRLPSVVLALILALCLYQLLRRWFGKPTALLSTAIFISADWFLFIARLGTGSIEFSLWLCAALVCFTKLLEHKTTWLLPLSLTLAGLLFAPFGIFTVITLLVSLFGCKIFRERTNEAALFVKIGSGGVLLLSLIAIGVISWFHTDFLKNLLGIQALPGFGDYFKNLFTNSSAVAVVLPGANPAISPSGLFFVRFFELIFIAFGVIMLWRTRVNRLNLTVLVLSVILVVASGLSAGSRGSSLLLVPAAIFMTAGIRHLVHRWQRTFPKNPYARVTAFIPLGLLFICVVALHYVIYFQLWPSQAATRTAFTPDLALVQHELNLTTHKNSSCYVDTTDPSLQTLITASKTTCRPIFPTSALPRIASTFILRPTTNIASITTQTTSTALVSETRADSVRWVVVNN